nr:hypothetical protein [Tanacetum cinerariifolium]
MDGGDLSIEHKLAFDGCLEIRVLFKGPDVLKKVCDGTRFLIDRNDDDIGATQVDRWPPRVTLERLLPHARGLGFKPRYGGFPSGAKKE